jgi:uncharacterized protein YbjT (DUF2867 family)
VPIALTMSEILVTGATGYIGGRLVPLLLERGHRVRCLARDPLRLRGRPWADRVTVVRGDVLAPDTLVPALDGIDAACYLVHSMRSGRDFHERDLTAASAFAAAAGRSGVGRLVYLGGLGDPDSDLSEHLRSRQETGEALRTAGLPVCELRAAIVVGSGSLSFEMIRYLTERLPVMVCPKWVFSRVQPIAVDDILAYLIAALERDTSVDGVVEVGGADVVTYGDMMRGYARARGLHRRLQPVPVLTPRLSSHWVYWVTPLPRSMAQPLIEGVRNEVVVRDRSAADIFPEIEPMGYDEAVALALAALNDGVVETSWTDALAGSQGDLEPVSLTSREGMIVERRRVVVPAAPENVFAAFTRLGGRRGWLYLDSAWRLRGLIDRAAGGVGLRRGRRDPDTLRIGDAVDFWRVEDLQDGRLLRLRAEMKLPGRAWLQFEAEPLDDGRTRLTQTALFAPKGLGGLLYWYGLYPVHKLVFSGMIARLALEGGRIT